MKLKVKVNPAATPLASKESSPTWFTMANITAVLIARPNAPMAIKGQEFEAPIEQSMLPERDAYRQLIRNERA